VPDPGYDGYPLLTVAGRRTGDQITIALTGGIDFATHPKLHTAVRKLLDATPVRHVTIDLAGLDFCDCAGARALLAAHRYATQNGAGCVIERAQPHIIWLLQATGANTVLAGPTDLDSASPTTADSTARSQSGTSTRPR
jgi:anti-anti-sigma factor